MRSDWKRVPVSDVCELIVDCVNKTAPRVDYPTPYKMIRTPNIKNGYIDRSDCRFVDRDTYVKWTRRATVEPGDVLLTREAPMGEVGYVDFKDTVFLGQRIMQYRTNAKELNSRYLLYAFLSPDLQNQFKMHEGSGSVVSHIRVPDCSKFEVNLPPIKEQDTIVSILGSIDDQIQLNHQINQTLEQMAQAIFKSWFVDFDPVKAKIAARERWYALQPGNESASPTCYAGELAGQPINIDLETYINHAAMQAISGKNAEQLVRMQTEKPEEYAELYATAELFPSAMQESELGEIPEGWSTGVLGDIASFTNGRVLKEELSLETYISTENMIENRMGVCRASSLPSSDSVPAFKPGEILISNIRPYFKKIWLSNIHGGRSPDVLGFSSKVNGASEYLFNLLYQDKFFEYMMLTSKGAKMPRGDKQAIMQFTSAIPDSDLMKYFSDQVRSFYTLSSVHTRESESLAATRDALLPKLLSGELSVADIESEFEA